ncbi:MAG TPA: hypothetical protein D7H87_08005 [Candidatus Poseidoniales archaeon]|mgnify:FL=1|nr:MAG TPA: hypothetical protein D7H87_08005 [Candidatus Poseidoniales archaeon]HII33231.1 hypothetical protein [Candidatus Poseidoniaceae archaeon]|tara:strand:- start:30 stop:269 length:240 start_codon:yes stop_codon:yes gene_type:complete
MNNNVPTNFAELTATQNGTEEPLWYHRTTTVYASASGKLPDRSKDITWTPWHQPGQQAATTVTTSIRNLIKRAALRGEA